MAKMFYTLEEAAGKLGVSEEQIKQLASSGKLQQFRDRDKLMFKRDQIDAMTTDIGNTGLAHVVDEDTGSIPLVDSGDTDAIDLKEAELKQAPRKEDPRQRTGISVFDADEVAPADPMAQTQVSKPVVDDEDLVLESVGSGSGLLDLTRESDDTSLGAELLDEIYPGGGEGSDAKLEPVAVGSSGKFESGGVMLESSASGLENMQQPGSGMERTITAPMVTYGGAVEAYDPAGSGLSTGMLFGAMAAVVIAMIIGVSAVQGVPITLTEAFSKNQNSLWIWTGVLLIASIIFGVVGFFIGKSMERRG